MLTSLFNRVTSGINGYECYFVLLNSKKTAFTRSTFEPSLEPLECVTIPKTFLRKKPLIGPTLGMPNFYVRSCRTNSSFQKLKLVLEPFPYLHKNAEMRLSFSQ